MYTARNCSRRVASAVLALGRSSHYLRPPLHSLPSAYYAGQPSLRLATHLQLLSYNSVALSTPSTSSASAAASSSLNLRPAQPARLLSAANEAPELAAHHHYTSNHDSISINKPSEVSEYWGIAPKHIQREDGSPWPWHCFTPADTYTADVGIDVERHYSPENSWVDRLAYWTVRALRGPVDLFFKDRHVSHALLLETVAAVPGMVGGMLLHLRSLRRFQHSGGWIKALLDEAENERMHLMTWVEVLRPAWWERALVLAVQGTFFNAYFVLYVASPRLAHRFVGYLEEEAVRSYTDFLEAIDAGNTPNGPAPLIATDYWRLPANATIRDVVLVVRADEAHHRDVNHFAADLYNDKQELRKSHAPIGYH